MARRSVHTVSALEQARRAAALSRSAVASMVSRCPETIARYERGDSPVPTDVLVILSQLYGVAPGDLTADPHVAAPATIATDLVALGQRLPPRERTELRRIVGDLAALVGDLHRLAPAHG